MTQPRKYVQLNDFSDQLTTSQVPGTHGLHLDQDFALVKQTTDQIISNLALIQRDDGALRNLAVHPDSLSVATKALIAGTWVVRGAWVTATAYAVGDVVQSAGKSYVAGVAHTSAAAFATDNAAGKWVILSENGLSVFDFGAASGTGDAMTVTIPITVLEDGMEIRVRAVAANTVAAPTINVNSLGAKPIVRVGGQALVASDYAIGQEITLRYRVSTGKFELLNPNHSLYLANTSDATQGATLVGFKDSAVGAVATNMSAYLNLQVKGLKRTFGAVGDDVADDYLPILRARAAMEAGKIVEAEDGTYRFLTALPEFYNGELRGFGTNATKFKPGPALTTGFVLTGQTRLMQLNLDGSLMADGQLIQCGGAANFWYGLISDVSSGDLQLVNGKGLWIYKTLKTAKIERFTGYRNAFNLLVKGPGDLPTTTTICNSVLTDALIDNCRIQGSAYEINFDAVDCESAQQAGWRLIPDGPLIGLHWSNGCWNEDNWRSLYNPALDPAGAPAIALAAARLLKFHFMVGDGSAGQAVHITVDHMRFGGGIRSILADGASAKNVTINAPELEEVADSISFIAGAAGEIPTWVHPLDYDTIVNDPLDNVKSPHGLKRRHVTTGAKVGAVAGWVINPPTNIAYLATLPAAQAGAVLVVPMPDLRAGLRCDGFFLVGVVTSAGNHVLIDAQLRKIKAGVDSLVATQAQIDVTANTTISRANSGTSTAVKVAEDETFYMLITATTNALTTISVQSVALLTQGL